MWLNTASAEEDQHLLLHYCLFSPAHRFTHIVWIMREVNAGLCRNQTIKMLRIQQDAVESQVVEKQSLHCLPSDPNIRKEWMNFIFNEVPDRISKNLVLCSLHFTADSFTNQVRFDAGFSERLKLKDNAVPIILDLTVMSQNTSVSNCFYYVITIALSVKLIVWYVLNHSSVHLWRM